jgi:hypothetical protein
MATIKVKRTLTSNPPAGLTFGELAFVQGITSFYVTNNVGTSVRIGAEVDTNINLGTSDNKIPTQNAVKQYVDTAVSASGTNQFNQIGVVGQPGLTADSSSDILTFAAGTGITLTTNAGTDTLTIGNTGVVSILGTTNEIEVSGTGTVTVGLPNDVTVSNNLNVGNNLTVTGNLTINGTTTTVNSDVTTVDDPIMLLGTSGGVPITVTDGGKDRGIAFTYFDGSVGRTGFMGFDASASKFTFVPVATIVSDTVTSGNAGDAQFKSLYLTTDGTNIGGLTLAALTGSRTYTLPNVSGTIITTGDSQTVTSTMIADGTIVNDDINAAAGIVDTKLAQIATLNKVALTALDINGATDIGSALTDTDLFIVDDGATETNRKATASKISDYIFAKITGGDITIASNGVATIAANSVALGTDTTGNYAADVSVSGIGLTVTGSAGEGTSYVITSGATSANSVSQIVARDASGNFSAGTITATLTGNALTASTLQTARTIGLTGDVSGSVSFNGSADVNITATIAANSVALGTDTTGNYVATVATTSAGLVITNSGTETAGVGINLQKVNTGIDFGTFAFTANEFTNNGSGTVAIGVVDGGSY